jgi:hypothetical protein
MNAACIDKKATCYVRSEAELLEADRLGEAPERLKYLRPLAMS